MANILDLTKSLELNLQKAEIFTVPKMAVKIAVDRSGSMGNMYGSNGWVQSTIDLFLVAAIKFDDDGRLEIGFFNSQFEQTRDVVESDVGTYLKSVGVYANGGTNFAEAIKTLKGSSESKKGLFSMFKKSTLPTPVYIALITDGENTDKYDFEKELSTLDNTFVQIVGIGPNVQKSYLDGVASTYKSVSVVYLPNPQSVDSSSFYELLLNDALKNFIK